MIVDYTPADPHLLQSTRVPTILHAQGFAFSFFASDRAEPPHIHVRGSGGKGKWWLARPVATEARSVGFTASEKRKINAIIAAHHGYLLARWEDFFSRTH